MKNKRLILAKFVFVVYLSVWQLICFSFLSDSLSSTDNNIHSLSLKVSDTSQKINLIVKNNEVKIPTNSKSISSGNHFLISNIELKCSNDVNAVKVTSQFKPGKINLTDKVSPRSPPALLS
jgi:hypothetical protein